MSWHYLQKRVYLLAEVLIYDSLQALQTRVQAIEEGAGVLLKIMREPSQGGHEKRSKDWSTAWAAVCEEAGQRWIHQSLCRKSSFCKWQAHDFGARCGDGGQDRKEAFPWGGGASQKSPEVGQQAGKPGDYDEVRSLQTSWDAISIADEETGWSVCVNLRYSLEQEEVSSEAICWDGERFAPSSGQTTLGRYCLLDSETESCLSSQSGTMSKPSTGVPGLDSWMSSLEDSHARTSAQQARAQESTASGRACGPTWPGSSAKYDPASRSWKTAQYSLLAGLDEFSETWPRWGSMRNGGFLERSTPERRISENGSGLWPTIRAQDGERGGRGDLIQAVRGNENTHFRNRQTWSIPTANCSTGAGHQGRQGGLNLQTAVKWATPTVCGNYNKKGASAKSGDGLATQAGGALNPKWVEGLMGWPMNWTCADPMSELDFALWEMGFVNECERNKKSAMRALRSIFDQEAVWGAAGRPDSLRETALLLAELCEHENRSDQARIFLACAKTSEVSVRGVRGIAVAPGAPCGPDEGKQLTRKYSDALPLLSQLLARYGKKAWESGSWEDAIPRVTKNEPHRVDRLRAIGNGQVPAVAAMAFRILRGRLGV